MSINWYPGHMAKTRRLLADDIKHVDVVCEILDARLPVSSRNPDLDALVGSRRRLIVLNRADQAEPAATERWLAHYRAKGYIAIATDSRQGGFKGEFVSAVGQSCADLLAKNAAKGIKKRIRVMIVGIPNVGKSSFINRLLDRKPAIVADKPGVTRRNQWFSIGGEFDFMDTPGMLWPKIDDDQVGYKLAFVGTIRDEVLDLEDLACKLIQTLLAAAPKALEQRYGVDLTELFAEGGYVERPPEAGGFDGEFLYRALCALARARGFIRKGNEEDAERMARTLLDEFRAGKLGRITLDRV